MTPLDPGLLQNILDSPADDAARLIAADWLEEHGETARAEFIRLQCRLARLEAAAERAAKEGVTAGRVELQQAAMKPLREREELLHVRCAQWTAELFGVAMDQVWFPNAERMMTGAFPQQPIFLSWRRGFVGVVRCTLADWRGGVCPCMDVGGIYDTCPTCGGAGRLKAHGPAIVAAHPVEQVDLSDLPSVTPQTTFAEFCRLAPEIPAEWREEVVRSAGLGHADAISTVALA